MSEKKVSLTSTVLFTVCSILVLDSFVSPAIIGVPAITVWILTAIVFFLPYGLLSAELGSTYPDDGGIVSWVTRAFGERSGVVVGWMYWINVAFWMPAVFTAFSGWLSLALFPEMPMFVQGLIAVAMCWVCVFIGVRGIDMSVKVANFFAILKTAILLLFGLMGVVYAIKNGAANDFSLANWVPTLDDTIVYVAVIVYNLLGFELIGSIGSQIEDAKRTVPKMIVIAGIAITFLYAFGTFGVLAAIPADAVDEVDGFVYALQELCSLFGPAQNAVFYILIALSISTLVANMITWMMGANESFQGAELDSRSNFLAHRHPVHGTSDNLYYLMGAISTVLIVLNYALSGDANDIFWTIFSFGSIIFMLCYVYMFAAFIKLKLTDNTPRAYEVPGGKAGAWIVTILCEAGVLLSVYFLIDWDFSSYGFWMELIGTLLTFASGLWLYRAGLKKK